MRWFSALVLVTVLAACDNAGKVKADIDTTAKDIRNSSVIDSISAKSERAMDSVKKKSEELLDSAKRKGGHLLNRAGDGLKTISKKLDTTK